jgi:predicted lipoprotein with Yx(FWY)xxD motif
MQRVGLSGMALILSAAGAFAAGMLAAPDGMTLYTFDKDKAGVSACYDDCAKKWPPFLGKTGEKMPKDWALMKRADGTMQWTYDGKPTYFFAGDKKKGDAAGDGMGKMWHVIKE